LIALSIKLIPVIVLSEAREWVKENPGTLKKTNWPFAVLIIIIWLIALFYTYQFFRNRFSK
jgi:hypothetical protein